MNKRISFIALLLIFFFTGCSIEVEPPAGKDKEPTKNATYGLDNVSPGSSLLMLYKAGYTNDIYYSQIIPNDEKCTTLEKRLKNEGNGDIPQASESPSQAIYDQKLYIIHKGGSTNNIYYSYFDGVTWSGDTQIRVCGAPAALERKEKDC